MQYRKGHRRAVRRRGAPRPPKRRRREKSPVILPASAGFEALVPSDPAESLLFTDWLEDPEAPAELRARGGEARPRLRGDPRVGVAVSAALHFFLVVFLLVEPSFDFLRLTSEPRTEVAEIERNEPPLVLFMEEPAVEPPAAAPIPDTAQPEEPPPVADNRLLIPKAALPPPPDKRQEFMNDLPFSEGNTEEFYTDEEVEEPGTEGEPAEEIEEEPPVVAESGEDESFSEASEGSETESEGAEIARRIDPEELGDLLAGMPGLSEEARPRADIRPPEPRVIPGEEGEGGENGAFTDIRRFLAGAQFHNPEGGLVTNSGPTLYYNNKGADFVPWIRRMLAEVRRNWIVPYSVSFKSGHVAVAISVARDGNLTDLRVLVPSGTSGFDNAAVGALRAADLLPLPSDYPDDRFDIILVFWYNERPYDIFG